jgi:protein-L-isoaspartate(D-aspartate) O-methyltransferase
VAAAPDVAHATSASAARVADIIVIERIRRHDMDFEQARFNMVEQQIRTWDVLDQGVLDLLFQVKREDFVPPAYRALAFADLEIPLSDGAFMWTPKMEARVLQELELRASESVIEIGTGSGYLTALLARQCAQVTSVEFVPALAASAKSKLRRAGIENVRVEEGDAARGYGASTYDAIVLTGSTPVLPDTWLKQLKPGGRLFAIVGDAPVMTARLMQWNAPEAIASEDMFETVVAPLRNALQPARFVF